MRTNYPPELIDIPDNGREKEFSVSNAWERLSSRIDELYDLGNALSLLSWDQLVMMPPAGGEGRARALATLEALYHSRLADPELGSLLEDLSGDESLDQDKAASVRIMRRDHRKATCVPPELVREIAELRGLTYDSWTRARPASDFSIMQPNLEKLIELKKQEAEAIGFENELYDALLDDFEPGMTAKELEPLFAELTSELRTIVEKVLEVVPEKAPFLSATYDPATQDRFCQWLVRHIGFDDERGRLDVSPHPFTQHIGRGDVRQTTRYLPNMLMSSIYASIHETGHALYEQGFPEELEGQPVGHTPSLGMHESQSRMWENQVGRGRAFSSFMLTKLKDYFEPELGMVGPDEFYEAVNHPRRSLIRVEADELTYNLHVALRFELELALFRGELAVADLPDAWDAAMEKNLGIRPDSQANGVLQDMHWAGGMQGYFPTYTLGTLYSAAFYDKANEELDGLEEDFARGETSRLLNWLRENIHREAYRYPAKELAQRVLGEEMTARPFLNYVKKKYGELYEVEL